MLQPKIRHVRRHVRIKDFCTVDHGVPNAPSNCIGFEWGGALAALVSGSGGQDSIAGCVRDFRRNVTETLGRELGLKVGRDDVIETSKAGYRLNAKIVVKNPPPITETNRTLRGR